MIKNEETIFWQKMSVKITCTRISVDKLNILFLASITILICWPGSHRRCCPLLLVFLYTHDDQGNNQADAHYREYHQEGKASFTLLERFYFWKKINIGIYCIPFYQKWLILFKTKTGSHQHAWFMWMWLINLCKCQLH